MARHFGVALTGGIGSGKSTVAAAFAKHGVAIVDTDAISHQLTTRDGAAIDRIRDEFGQEYIIEGKLDRAKMRDLVFSDPLARKKLESILHPMIRKTVEQCAAESHSPYYLLVIPLLFESDRYQDLIDCILVVDCSEEKQIERTMERSALNRAEVLSIMQSQVDRSVRLSRADDVIVNEGSLAALESEVARLHAKYLAKCLKNPS